MKAKDLKEMIASIVTEELKKQLPAMIESVLSERYIRNIVNEKVGVVGESQDDDPDDHIPEPLKNDNKGIYGQHPLAVKGGKRKIESPLLSNENPMSFLYEGIDKLPSNPMATPSSKDVPLEALGVDINKIKKLLGNTGNQQANKTQTSSQKKFDPALDTPVVQHQQQQKRSVNRVSNVSSLIDGPAFPDKPITFDD